MSPDPAGARDSGEPPCEARGVGDWFRLNSPLTRGDLLRRSIFPARGISIDRPVWPIGVFHDLHWAIAIFLALFAVDAAIGLIPSAGFVWLRFEYLPGRLLVVGVAAWLMCSEFERRRAGGYLDELLLTRLTPTDVLTPIIARGLRPVFWVLVFMILAMSKPLEIVSVTFSVAPGIVWIWIALGSVLILIPLVSSARGPVRPWFGGLLAVAVVALGASMTLANFYGGNGLFRYVLTMGAWSLAFHWFTFALSGLSASIAVAIGAILGLSHMIETGRKPEAVAIAIAVTFMIAIIGETFGYTVGYYFNLPGVYRGSGASLLVILVGAPAAYLGLAVWIVHRRRDDFRVLLRRAPRPWGLLGLVAFATLAICLPVLALTSLGVMSFGSYLYGVRSLWVYWLQATPGIVLGLYLWVWSVRYAETHLVEPSL